MSKYQYFVISISKNNSKVFWLWYFTLIITGLLKFSHCPVSWSEKNVAESSSHIVRWKGCKAPKELGPLERNNLRIWYRRCSQTLLSGCECPENRCSESYNFLKGIGDFLSILSIFFILFVWNSVWEMSP